MSNDFEQYQFFTKPAELHKAINTLRGIVAGITTDRSANPDEINELIYWCQNHSYLSSKHPFSELIPIIERVCADGIVTEDEAQDILWLCGNFASNAAYYDDVTSGVQFLSGMIHGIMADNALSDGEIMALKTWINSNNYLEKTYPFDEISSMLYSVLDDGVISDDERTQLLAFFSSLIEFKDSLNLVEKDYAPLREQCHIGGICAICPEITFENMAFCFTGEFTRGERKELEHTVQDLGALVRTTVTKKTDYLIVGNSGNPCWAYSCYGRKIETAMNLRKEGAKVQIVNENDFWDAVDDKLAGVS